MKFHWEKDGKNGSFTVNASAEDGCIEIARKEIEEGGAELIDYYSV